MWGKQHLWYDDTKCDRKRYRLSQSLSTRGLGMWRTNKKALKKAQQKSSQGKVQCRNKNERMVNQFLLRSGSYNKS